MEIEVSAHPDWGAVVSWAKNHWRCAVGRGGIGVKLREGDGITPVGLFALRHIYFRPDRIGMIRTGLPSSPIEPDDGWCDAPTDPDYNRPIKLPYHASAEPLWREDGLYDLLVVIGFNDDPVVAGAGSAIFLHVAHPDFSVTEGCLALPLGNLLTLAEQLSVGDRIRVVG
jgi:L,D-peptidoglycan transpeptidase YkuD (ErfK/YbiS/YcfS/YnhG family)